MVKNFIYYTLSLLYNLFFVDCFPYQLYVSWAYSSCARDERKNKPRRRLPRHQLVSLKITRTEPVRLMWVQRRMSILPASWIILFPHSTRILHGGMEAITQAFNLIILDIQSAKSHWKHKRTTIHR